MVLAKEGAALLRGLPLADLKVHEATLRRAVVVAVCVAVVSDVDDLQSKDERPVQLKEYGALTARFSSER